METLIEAGSLDKVLPLVRFMDGQQQLSTEEVSSEGASSVSHCSTSASSLIQDLILVTSYLCNEVFQSMTDVVDCTGRSRSKPMGGSMTALLIALAPYWAITSLIAQLKDKEEDAAHRETVKNTLGHLLRAPLTLKAACEVSSECINLLSVTESMQPQAHPDSLITRLATRMRKALRTHLHHPLFFCVVLSLSLRSDLAAKLSPFFTAASDAKELASMEKMLRASDANSAEIVELVVIAAPKLVLRPDHSSLQATPLIYAAMHRSAISVATHNSGSLTGLRPVLTSTQLVLHLVQTMTTFVPSALTLADAKGMFPLHYAARRGYSAALDFLASRYGSFTLTLMDQAGKFPLHHALLSHTLHSEDDIVRLAALCPQLLLEVSASTLNQHVTGETAFKPLQYAKKVSRNLFERLSQLARQVQEQQREQLAQQQQQSTDSNMQHQESIFDSSFAVASSSSSTMGHSSQRRPSRLYLPHQFQQHPQRVDSLDDSLAGSTSSQVIAVHSGSNLGSSRSISSSSSSKGKTTSFHFDVETSAATAPSSSSTHNNSNNLQYYAQSLLMLQHADSGSSNAASPVSSPVSGAHKKQNQHKKRSYSEFQVEQLQQQEQHIQQQPEILLDGSGASSVSSEMSEDFVSSAALASAASASVAAMVAPALEVVSSPRAGNVTTAAMVAAAVKRLRAY